MGLSLASFHDLDNGSIDLACTIMVDLILDFLLLWSLFSALLLDLLDWNEHQPDLLVLEIYIQLESLIIVIKSRRFFFFFQYRCFGVAETK